MCLKGLAWSITLGAALASMACSGAPSGEISGTTRGEIRDEVEATLVEPVELEGAVGQSSRRSPVRTRSVPDCALGVVLADQTVDVLAEAEGRLLEVLVEPGRVVAAGELVARLENRRLEHRLARERGTMQLIEAEVKSFAVQLEQADRQHQRHLAMDGLLSRQTIDTSAVAAEVARYRLDVAYAEVVQQRARLAELEAELERLEIRAPFSGTVALRYVEPGMVLAAGQRVVRLLGTRVSRVRFAVPPADAEELRPGLRLRVETGAQRGVLPASIRHVAPAIDGPSEMIFVEADLERAELEPDAEETGLLHGAVVRVSRLDAVDDAGAGGSCGLRPGELAGRPRPDRTTT
ncbi:MAG: efflux RND transporter periplasmic adaptor subunit [Acidobacteriota bacterium]